MEFDTEEALARHELQVHRKERKVVGSCCERDFYTYEGLREHQRTVHASR
jgi:hypothetical protein